MSEFQLTETAAQADEGLYESCTPPHLYQALQPHSEDTNDFYVNRPSQNDSSSINNEVKSEKPKSKNKVSKPFSIKVKGGPESHDKLKVLITVLVCGALLILMLVTAISIAALVLALDRCQNNSDSISQNAYNIDTLNMTFARRLEDLISLVPRCSSSIEATCTIQSGERQCSTQQVDYTRLGELTLSPNCTATDSTVATNLTVSDNSISCVCSGRTGSPVTCSLTVTRCT